MQQAKEILELLNGINGSAAVIRSKVHCLRTLIRTDSGVVLEGRLGYLWQVIILLTYICKCSSHKLEDFAFRSLDESRPAIEVLTENPADITALCESLDYYSIHYTRNSHCSVVI